MVTKAVKLNKELYDDIVKLIKKSEYKYKYSSISSFVNVAISEKLKEDKHNVKFFKIKL